MARDLESEGVVNIASWARRDRPEPFPLEELPPVERQEVVKTRSPP